MLPSPLGDGTHNIPYVRKNTQENPLVSSKKPAPSVSTRNLLTVGELRRNCLRVNSALLKLDLLSRSLGLFIDKLDEALLTKSVVGFDRNRDLINTIGNPVVLLSAMEVKKSQSNMSLYLGPTATSKILKLRDIEDKLLLLSFADIEKVTDSKPEVVTRRKTNVFFIKRVRNINRRKKQMEVNRSNILEVAAKPFMEWADWRIDYAGLQDALNRYKDVVTDASGLRTIMEQVASSMNIPAEAMKVVIAIECGWPDGRSSYRATMPRDDGSLLYRGVSQASKGFWQDIREYAAARGVKGIPTLPENATLAMQVAAPFIYLDRYKKIPSNKVSVYDFPLTPALVYAFHQQSRGGLAKSFNPGSALGIQSGQSMKVLRIAHSQRGQGGKRLSL